MRFFTIYLLLLFLILFTHKTRFCWAYENDDINNLKTSALESFDKGWYKKSIELFTQLNNQYPFNMYDDIAHLRIADAHFELGHYSDAVDMYQRFQRMYPYHKLMSYVLYRMACAYLNQTRSLDHDQANTNMALDTYLELIRKFSNSEYVSAAYNKIDVCYEKLSGYEFKIGMFYYKKGKYSSALSRFLKIVSTYPDLGYHRTAIIYILDCENSIKN